MGESWIPSYMGSYGELLNALLYNPLLGSGRVRHPLLFDAYAVDPARFRMASNPMPGSDLVTNLVSLTALKIAASQLQQNEQKVTIIDEAESSISSLIDEYCGTPPHPRPKAAAIAAELTIVAASLPEGDLQAAIQNIATQALQKASTVN